MDGPVKTYRGLLDCTMKIIRHEGAFALYKGILSPLLGVAFLNSIAFGSYISTLRTLERGVDRHDHRLSNVFVAGCASGFIQSFLSSPIELAKVLLQMQTQPVGKIGTRPQLVAAQEFSGPMDVYRRLIQQKGVRGVYVGLVACLARDVPGFAIYFSSYHFLCNALTPVGERTETLSTPRLLLSGGLAGMASWTLFYPFDVIKSRLQAQEKGPIRTYNGIIDCVRTSVKNEGWRSLWKGLVPQQVRAFPSNAAVFYVYTLTYRLLEKMSL
ncbi:mitochondrial basic amino acids transporter-like isoform X2 [Oscarella lobularis]